MTGPPRSRTSLRTGRRSTTRPATRRRPTSWTGPPNSRVTCAEAQLALEHLARRVAGQRVDHRDLARHLELRELRAAQLDQLLGRHAAFGRIRREHHVRDGHLAPALVGPT